MRNLTEHTHGVWTTCDLCGEDWWCIGIDRDYMDEPTRYVCSDGCLHDRDVYSDGCDDGWGPDD